MVRFDGLARLELGDWRDPLADRIDLTAWLDNQAVIYLLAGFTGTGFPDAQLSWFEGAGDGGLLRNDRYKPRVLSLPLFLQADDRASLTMLVEELARALTPRVTEPYLCATMADNTSWYLNVVRSSTADWVWGIDTDGKNWARLTLTLVAGDPYWTALETSEQVVLPLELEDSRAEANQQVLVRGDAPVKPVWVVTGPGRWFRADSPDGDVLATYPDVEIGAGQELVVDTQRGLVYDGDTGENHYDWLAPAPRFWELRPGGNEVGIRMSGTSTGEWGDGPEAARNLVTNPVASDRAAWYGNNLGEPVMRTGDGPVAPDGRRLASYARYVYSARPVGDTWNAGTFVGGAGTRFSDFADYASAYYGQAFNQVAQRFDEFEFVWHQVW